VFEITYDFNKLNYAIMFVIRRSKNC